MNDLLYDYGVFRDLLIIFIHKTAWFEHPSIISVIRNAFKSYLLWW